MVKTLDLSLKKEIPVSKKKTNSERAEEKIKSSYPGLYLVRDTICMGPTGKKYWM